MRRHPEHPGAGGCIGDIGTHAFHLAGFVTGLRAEAVAADLSRSVIDRRLDDNAPVMPRSDSSARGILWASQVAVGHDNALRLRIRGETCGLDLAQEAPDRLWHSPLGAAKRLLTRAGPSAARLSRLPPGHPEGYLEAFANLYAEAAAAILARAEIRDPPPEVHFPGIADGLAGMAFVDACVRSSSRDTAWVTFARP